MGSERETHGLPAQRSVFMLSSGSSRSKRCVLVASIVFVALALVAHAQEPTPRDVEQHVRAGWAAWNSGDPVRISELDAQIGFGYRTRDPRPALSKEQRLAAVKAFLASVQYYRITPNEIHTAVDGDIGLAWGFFTEEFQVRGRAPEKVSVRFSGTLKRDKTGWRRLLYHRDAQPFDENSRYIPSPAAAK